MSPCSIGFTAFEGVVSLMLSTVCYLLADCFKTTMVLSLSVSDVVNVVCICELSCRNISLEWMPGLRHSLHKQIKHTFAPSN